VVAVAAVGTAVAVVATTQVVAAVLVTSIFSQVVPLQQEVEPLRAWYCQTIQPIQQLRVLPQSMQR
jgi:hypothetical protein